MAKDFRDLLKDFPPERIARIERRKQQLESEMGVRKVDLTTDEVEYDSNADKAGLGIIPAWKHRDTDPQFPDEPRLQEIGHTPDWTHPLRRKDIILDDETLEKLGKAMAEWHEEWQKKQREEDQ